MKNIQYLYIIALSVFIILTSCNTTKEENEQNTEQSPVEHQMQGTQAGYKFGNIVPVNQVCMVNNAYMAKEQIEVPHEGKMYYGCCNMCVKRIPEDIAVRVALDPQTGNEVNKSEATIAILGENGKVGYFENEQSLKDYLAQNKKK